jgi:AAA family ATP:ADP antiporter
MFVMLKAILDSLNVKPEERAQVLLMLGAGFFMGIFIATYQVTAESLFLNRLSYLLNKAFLISGILGIASTFVFSAAQNRVKFTNLTISSIVTIVAVTTGVYVLYNYGNPANRDYVLFAMYCLTGPTTAILLLCYWGIFGRLFNFKQSKRIIGWIDTGQLIAIILANFLIPITASFFVETDNYLIVCNISILITSAFFILISFRFPLTRNNPKEFDSTVREETGFNKIFKDRYILLLSLFLVTSMVTFIFSQYSFQNLINIQYPDQRDLTNFLAFFNGSIYALSLIMQTFVNDRILSNYGIRTSLFILPIVVGIFAIGSVITGFALGYDPVANPETFIFFFLFVALTRLFNGMLRDSLENPVYKLLFIPLDGRYRFGIQSKVEGVVNESGRFIAGGLIFIFALFASFEIVFIPVLIVILIIVYVFASRNLYNGYRNTIRAKLENTDYSQEKLEIGYAQITKRLESQLDNKETSKAIFSFKLLEKINPAQVPVWVNNLMKNEAEEARDYAQRRMNEIKGLSVSERYVIRIDQKKAEATDRNVLTKADLESIINSGGDITKTRVQRLSRSSQPEDRQYAAELLLHSSSDENVSFLIELLNDPEPKVRHTAIKTSIKKNNNEVIHALIENLANPLYGNQAMNALVLIGGKALHLLDGSFYRSGQSTQSLLRIIQVMGRIGGQRAKDLLWNKIDYPDKVIVSQVLLSLGECGFKAGISQITRIKYAIESDIADISWNLSAIQEVGNDGLAKDVKQALSREIQNDIEHIYMLLAMLYDTRSIQLVKENIESGTTEGTTYAVELLDVFLSEQLKVRVIPVLDELQDTERINRLEAFYPRVRLDEKLVLKFLINRDFTQSNRWTKATVLYQIGTLRIQEFMLDLIAQLFNPDRLIREVAAWALYQINAEAYHSNSSRLGEQIKRTLDKTVVGGMESGSLMQLDKVKFFQRISVFDGVSGLSLSYLADIAEEVVLTQNQSMVIDEKVNNNFYIDYNGAVEYYERGVYGTTYQGGQFIGEMLSSSGFANSNILRARERTVLLRINKDQFYELLSDNVKLADRVLDFV